MISGRFRRHSPDRGNDGPDRHEQRPHPRHSSTHLMAVVLRHLESRLVAGLLVFLPIFVTYVIFGFFYDFIEPLLDPVFVWINVPHYPGLGFAALVIIVYLMGLFIGWAVAKFLVHQFHNLIARVPVIGAVYNTTRQGIDFLSDTQQSNYRGVVLFEFPRLGVLSIGLITSELGKLDGVQEFLSIYVPTTPIPSSGYLVILPANSVTPTDMSVEEAMRMIISGGIIAGDIFRDRTMIQDRSTPSEHWLWGGGDSMGGVHVIGGNRVTRTEAREPEQSIAITD